MPLILSLRLIILCMVFVSGIFGLQEVWMKVIEIEKRVEKEELKETREKSLTDAAKAA